MFITPMPFCCSLHCILLLLLFFIIFSRVTDRVQPVRILIGHAASVNCIAFHPNCNYIVSGSDDGTLRVWHISSARCVRLLLGHRGPVRCVAVSNDGRLIASGGEDKRVIVWDMVTGLPLWCGDGTAIYPKGEAAMYIEGENSEYAKSADPAWGVITGSSTRLGAPTLTRNLPGHALPVCPGGTAHTDTITSVSFSAEGSLLASCSLDGTVKLWNARAKPPVPTSSPASTASNGSNLDSAAGSLSIPLSYEAASQALGQVLIKTYYTKSTPMWFANFTERNVLLSAGVYQNPLKR